MKKIFFAFCLVVLFTNCNKTNTSKCCTGAPQIVTIDSCVIAMPDIFTPNGDGVNDELRVLTKNIVGLTITIKKRFGREVFSSTDMNKGWDGKFQGKLLKEKRYTYTIEARTTSGNGLSLSGDICLVRDNCLKGSENCFFGSQFNGTSFDAALPSNESIKACN